VFTLRDRPREGRRVRLAEVRFGAITQRSGPIFKRAWRADQKNKVFLRCVSHVTNAVDLACVEAKCCDVTAAVMRQRDVTRVR
jgi:hypothetical protein